MKFNPEHKETYKAELGAVKWLISKAKVFEDITEKSEIFGRYRVIASTVSMNIPWHMREKLDRLVDAGYRRPDRGGLITFDTENTTQTIHWQQGQYKSNQNHITFCYTKYEYLDMTITELEKLDQAA